MFCLLYLLFVQKKILFVNIGGQDKQLSEYFLFCIEDL